MRNWMPNTSFQLTETARRLGPLILDHSAD